MENEEIRTEELVEVPKAPEKERFVMLSIKPTTKERLYKLKSMNEKWDAMINRILDKVVADGDKPI